MKNSFSSKNIVLNILIFTLLALPAFASAETERVYLDISAPEARKINIAVPWFVNSGSVAAQESIGKIYADVIAKSLKFHGIIKIIPTTDYNGSQVANWQELGADYVVLGKYQILNKKVKLEMRLLDVTDNSVLLGKSYTGTDMQKNAMLFKFTDMCIESLTGAPGVASTRIAFVSYERNTKDIYMTDILGRKIRRVTRHNNLTVSPRFTPDGNFLSYSSYHSGNQNLYITDLRQNKITKSLSRRKGMNLAPAWAPDGQSMVLTLSQYGAPDLYRMDRSGSIIEQLTKRSGVNISATYSPDGKYIVFVSDRSGRPQLYLMNLNTKKQRRLTYDGSENAEPNWSPTENKIVYSSLRDGIYQLCILDPFTTDDPIQITKDLTRHEAPVWSPDGNQVIFTKRDGARQQIYAVMKNGSYQRRVFSLPGNQSSPRWTK